MVVLTQAGGRLTAVNAVLVERVEAVPETVVTLVDGTEYHVLESVPQVLDKLQAYHASILATTARLLAAGGRRPDLRLLQGGQS